MSPFDLSSLSRFQQMVAIGVKLTPAQQDEFERLLKQFEPEIADDPRTLFVDESSRPQIDGTNYNDEIHRIACNQLKDILVLVGREAFKVLIERVQVS